MFAGYSAFKHKSAKAPLSKPDIYVKKHGSVFIGLVFNNVDIARL